MKDNLIMKMLTAAVASLLTMTTIHAQTNTAAATPLPTSVPTLEDVRAVSPALERYTTGPLLNELWKRPDLSPRDRSIVTLSVLIARNQTIEMPYHFRLALDNGVKPAEISEIITHLAFYTGWANAILLPIDQASEDRRAASVKENAGPVSPGLVHFTGALLFNDLWLRPDLAPRDRSLVTVSALIATGQVAQITFHLNRAMDNGLTQAQAAEVITHVAFYAGWPNAFSAVPVAKAVFDSRSK